jgi:hypothetical protein
MNADESLTVSELAEHITRSGDPAEIARVTRRLRHLTTIGALDTAGDVHTGAGRHRLYGPDSTAAAAVLVALGDMGLTVGILKQAARLIRMTMLPTLGKRERWEEAIAGKPMLLVIGIGSLPNWVTDSSDTDAGEPGIRSISLATPDEFRDTRPPHGDTSGMILLDLQYLFRKGR